MEAQLCMGEEVIVVGGGNSASQDAVFLTNTTKRFYMLIRSEGLVKKSMSRYLIRRIEEENPIILRPYTEIIEVQREGTIIFNPFGGKTVKQA